MAVNEGSTTLHRINGIEVNYMIAIVDTNPGKMLQYRAGVKVSFGIEH